MFARLGSWCFRRRKTRRRLLGDRPRGRRQHLRRRRWRLRTGLHAARLREHARASTILEDEFGGQGAGIPGTIVFRAEQGVDDPEVKAAMEQLFAMVTAIAADPDIDVASPTPSSPGSTTTAIAGARERRPRARSKGMHGRSPYDEAGARTRSPPRARGGQDRLRRVEIPGDDWEEAGAVGRSLEDAPAVRRRASRSSSAARRSASSRSPPPRPSGLAFAVVILVLAFGSVLAMGLPVGVALSGIVAGSVIVTILSNLIVMPDFAPFLGDHDRPRAWASTTRCSSSPASGRTSTTATRHEESVAIAIDTAGRAVAFAGVTVVVSFLGMIVMGVSFITGLAVERRRGRRHDGRRVAHPPARPARLRRRAHRGHPLAGRDRDRASWPSASWAPGSRSRPWRWLGSLLAVVVFLVIGLRRACPLKRELRRRPPKPVRETFAYRWSRADPAPPLAGRHRRCALPDRPGHPGARPAARLLRREQLPGGHHHPARPTTSSSTASVPATTGPSCWSPRSTAEVDPAVLAGVTDAVAADPDVALRVAGHPERPEEPTAVLWQVTPRTSPQDEATTQLIHRLRDDVLVDSEAALGHRGRRSPVRSPATVDFSHLPQLAHAVLLRRRARSVVPAPHDRVPVGARAAQGRDHEPAVDRRGLRHHGRRRAVGLAGRRHRPGARARSRRSPR